MSTPPHAAAQKPWRTLATFGELVRQGFVFKLRGEMDCFKDAAKDSKPAECGGGLLRFSW